MRTENATTTQRAAITAQKNWNREQDSLIRTSCDKGLVETLSLARAPHLRIVYSGLDISPPIFSFTYEQRFNIFGARNRRCWMLLHTFLENCTSERNFEPRHPPVMMRSRESCKEAQHIEQREHHAKHVRIVSRPHDAESLHCGCT